MSGIERVHLARIGLLLLLVSLMAGLAGCKGGAVPGP
jgi:hypothetical protein